MERLAVEVKFSRGEQGTFSGIASPFGGDPDAVGDVIDRGAFTKSLGEHTAAGTKPLLLWMHDPAEPLGVWLDIREDRDGLAVKGKLVLQARRAQEAYALLKAGALNGLSIGYRVRSAERRPEGGRTLKEVELVEISLVTLPAASQARVTDVKSAPAGTTAAKGAASTRRKTMAKKATVPDGDQGTEEEAMPVEERVTALEETVTAIDDRLKAVEGAVGTVKSTADRIEAKLNRPGFTTKPETPPAAELARKAFTGFLRQGREALGPDEVKTLITGDDTRGGYLAPPEFVAEVVKNLVEFSPVRQAAKVGQTAAGSVILPKRTGAPTATWVGEEEDRTEAAPSYGQAEIPVHEAACYVDVSLKLLEDAAVNVETEVAGDLAEEFGRLEGVAFVSGNGVKKPMGFMSDAGVSYVASGSATVVTADGLIDILYALPAFYRNRSSWMMNGTTLAACRKLKDGDGQYLWRPGLTEGQPETLLGRPVAEAVDMPDVAGDAFPIAIGDFMSAYRIYDRQVMSVLRDPYSMATKGLVRFHARRRVGGGVLKAEALRKLKIATS